MSLTRLSILSRDKVATGYLFYNMRNVLCVTIAMERRYAWCIEYKADDHGTNHWVVGEKDDHCPTWWAATHPAGLAPPALAEMKKMVQKAVARRLERVLQPAPDS